MDSFYQSVGSFGRPAEFGGGASLGKIKELFGKYKEPDVDEIGIDGMIQFVEDLGISEEDPALLVFACECGCVSMTKFSRDEFTQGFQTMNVDSIAGFKSALPALRAQLAAADPFKKIYTFAFGYYKEETCKSVTQETAESLWEMLFKESPFKFHFFDAWMLFLDKEHNKPISKDTWVLLLEFARQTNEKMDGYDPEGCLGTPQAWPQQQCRHFYPSAAVTPASACGHHTRHCLARTVAG
jgi:DCN1-like protein 1/2